MQSYLLTKLVETACLLLHVLMCVRQQGKVIGEVKASNVLKSVHLMPLGCSSVVRRITQSSTGLKRTADMTYL